MQGLQHRRFAAAGAAAIAHVGFGFFFLSLFSLQLSDGPRRQGSFLLPAGCCIHFLSQSGWGTPELRRRFY